MKRLFRLMQSAMSMDDDAWARHANPWSVYSRMTTLPLLAFAVWSRVWLGWWALVPCALALIWIWLNPRVFPKPATRREGWAAHGTSGERLFLADSNDVAEHHRRAVTILTLASLIGVAILTWGVVVLDPRRTLWGLTLAMTAKLWTFDRMVWLYRDTAADDSGTPS